MSTRHLAPILAIFLLAPIARAAEPDHQLPGSWNLTTDSLGKATCQITFTRDGNVTVDMSEKDGDSESHSSSSGPNWKQEPGKLVFDGSAQINQLKIAGAWKITWTDPDTLTAQTDDGKTYKLTRIKEKTR
jgi:hypothetical protein